MPAYFDKGFSVRVPAWHGLAVVLQDYPGREEAMKLAGHDFKIVEEKLFTLDEQIDGWKALKREDTKKIIAVVKDSYEIIQNEMIWDVLDAIIAQPNVRYETGGTLKDGAVVWALAGLDEPVRIKGDNSTIYAYLNVNSTHDGTGALRAFVTSIRTICMNTMSAGMSEAERTGLRYTFRHTKNVKDRIEFAKSALGLAKKEFSEFCILADELAEKQVTFEIVKDFLDRFIPAPPEVLTSERVKTNIETARMQVLDILNSSQTIPEPHRRTAYGLYCAGTEYLDHVRNFRNQETYLKRCIMDSSSAKNQLLSLVQEVSA